MKEDDSLSPISHEHSWSDVLKNLAFIAIAVGLAYFVTAKIGIDNLRETVSAAGFWGPLILVLLKATTIVVVPLGGGPVYAIAGPLFGFWAGLGWCLLGDALGATIAFYLSRFFGTSILKFFLSKQQMPMVQKFIDRSGEIKIFLKARLAFIGLPELFAYGAGLTKASFPLFITAHMGVHVLPAAMIVGFGSLLVGGSTTTTVGVAIISVALAIIGGWFLRLDLLKDN